MLSEDMFVKEGIRSSVWKPTSVHARFIICMWKAENENGDTCYLAFTYCFKGTVVVNARASQQAFEPLDFEIWGFDLAQNSDRA